MRGGFAVRALDAADVERAAAIQAAAFAPLEERAWPAAEIALMLNSPGARGLFMQRGGKEFAFALLRVVADEAELLTIAVHPSMHRRGAGRALLAELTAAARAAGAKSLFLEVGDDNAAAFALYRGAGFEPVGRRKGYYRRATRPAADAIVMRIAL